MSAVVPTLAELIAERRGGRKVAELWRDAGEIPSYEQWTSLVKGRERTEFPEVKTIRAIAKALDASVELVVLAAAETVGLKVDEPSELAIELARDMPASSRNLNETQRTAIRFLVMLLRSPVRPPPP